MRLSEIFRLVWLNLSQNKFKVILTSIGIVVGSATIMMVIAIGTGGKEEVAEQFKNLNAGAIDISFGGGSSAMVGYTIGGSDESGGTQITGGMPGNGFDIGSMPDMSAVVSAMPDMGSIGGDASSVGGGRGGASGDFSGGGRGGASGGFGGDSMPDMSAGGGFSFGGMGGFGDFSSMFGGGSRGDGGDNRMNRETITLTENDMEDLEVFVPGITSSTISYSTTTSVEGGELESASYYTIAGVLDNYATLSNLTISVGEFLSEENDDGKEKVCVLGYSAANEIFDSAYDAYEEEVYIDGRPYKVVGVLDEMGTVASGISPDTAIFIPYATGIKYITGDSISPTVTVIAEDVNNIDTVIANIETVLADSYPNTQFTISDAGSKMDAANASNDTLQLLLVSMAIIVFIVGGIGIMNVLFVSVKERTNEIGILKALGCSRRDILLEFLLEAACMSLVGAVIGVLLSLGITPIVELLSVRVELSVSGAVLSLVFGVVTGSVFGFYPAYKASRLVPVVALNAE